MSKARDLADFISDSTIETAEIADGAVTAGKLNVTGNGTSGQALTSDADGSFSWTTITSDLVDDASPQLGANLDTNGNDITFGDNDKAVFGVGSDLQIYHDGTHSYLDNTTGTLYLRNYSDDKDVSIQSDNGSGGLTTYVLADGSAGEVRLYHYTSEKFHTTSSGVNVIGTVTADGLTVDTATDVSINCSSPFDGIDITGSDVNGAGGRLQLLATGASGTGRSFAILNDSRSSVDEIKFQANTDFTFNNFDTGDNRLRIADNGDISFYEDTGTTPKFFWDASAERLGIGTTSPGRALEVYASGPCVKFNNGTNAWTIGTGGFVDGSDSLIIFDEGVGERMRIDSDGNLCLGVTDEIQNFGDGRTTLAIKGTGSADYAVINLANYGTTGASQIHGLLNFYDNTTAMSRIASLRGTASTKSEMVFYTTDNSGSGITEAMRIDSSGNLKFNSGYGSVATAYGCRAWVNFNGTGTVAIRNSGNVSSVTDLAQGRYRVNFSTSMPDANYVVCGTGGGSANEYQLNKWQNEEPTASGVAVITGNTGISDNDDKQVHVGVIR